MVNKQLFVPLALLVTGAGLGAVGIGLLTFGYISLQEDDFMQPAINLGLQILPTEAALQVFVNAMTPLHVKVSIFNLTKIEDDQVSPAGLTDLFPIGGPTAGQGSIGFRVENTNSDLMPVLDMEEKLVPFAFIRKEKEIKGILWGMMVFSSWLLNYWHIIRVFIIGIALLMVAGGGALLTMHIKQ